MTSHLTHEDLPEADDPAASTLIASMNNPFVFGHPVRYIRLIETHISWILLTGTFAYKIKKPVDFGFLDFSTLEITPQSQVCTANLPRRNRDPRQRDQAAHRRQRRRHRVCRQDDRVSAVLPAEQSCRQSRIEPSNHRCGRRPD
jgi:hypothetical protein